MAASLHRFGHKIRALGFSIFGGLQRSSVPKLAGRGRNTLDPGCAIGAWWREILSTGVKTALLGPVAHGLAGHPLAALENVAKMFVLKRPPAPHERCIGA